MRKLDDMNLNEELNRQCKSQVQNNKDGSQKMEPVISKEIISSTIYKKSNSGNMMLKQDKLAKIMAEKLKLSSTNLGDSSRITFFEYSDGFWKKTNTLEINKKIQDLLMYPYNINTINSVRGILSAEVYVRPDVFNANDHLLNLNNGVYDLKEFKFKPHSPEYYFTYKNQYDYDPIAICPEFDQALADYSLPKYSKKPDKDWINGFWEICGYCLSGGYEIQKMFWFLGSKGKNGKGTVIRVIQGLVGEYHSKANFDSEKLKGNFYKNALINKRLAITGDMSEKLMNWNVIKELTGGDRQATDVKFGDEVEFENKAKLVFAMNRLPTFPSTVAMEPILRRVFLLPFDYNITKMDHGIENKFLLEQPGIFNKAIEGLKRLRKNLEFTVCKRGQQQLKVYSSTVNLFQAFIDERIEYGEDLWVWNWFLFDDYSKFMNERVAGDWTKNNRYITDMNTFAREIQAKVDIQRSEREYCPPHDNKKGKYLKYYGIGLIEK